MGGCYAAAIACCRCGLELNLSSDTLAALARAVPSGAVAGERYPAAQLAYMDSEKGRSAPNPV
jgi:hypothetical protein